MVRPRLKLQEGWLTIVLLTFILLVVVWSVRAANWAPGLGILQWVALAGLLVGLLLASERRLPGVAAHLVSTVAGAAWVGFLLGKAFTPPLVPSSFVEPGRPWTGTANLMVQMALRSLSPDTSQAWMSNWMFLVGLSLLTWLLSYVSVWFVIRRHAVWGAVIPIGAACLLNTYYGPPRLTVYLACFFLGALLLMVRMHTYLSQEAWRRDAVNYNLDVHLTFLRHGAVISLLAILVAWTIPTINVNARLSRVWEAFQDPWHEVQVRWSRIFTSLNYQGPSSFVSFSTAMSLGGAVNLSDTPLFEVHSSEPHYWRAVAYDRYTGTGWNIRLNDEEPLQANQTGIGPLRYPSQRELTYSVHMLIPGESLLFLAGEPTRLGLPSKLRVGYQVDTAGDRFAEVAMASATRPLRRDQTYTVSTLVPYATANELMASGTQYPAFVSTRYLQLPRTVPGRVRTLAREVTRDARTPYEKVLALQGFLRQFEYDRQIAAPPPGRDVVDWFLFDSRKGYCDYFASALVVLARSIGIPSRLCQGYATGEALAGGAYRVKQSDAHAWPEVYFPEYGWMTFEPTSSLPAVALPLDPQEIPLTILGPLTAIDQQLGEEKFGPDDIAPVDPEATQAAEAPRQTWYMQLVKVLLAVICAAAAVSLAGLGWWLWRSRGLGAAASVYEQMVLVGRFFGVAHRASHTPSEYSALLAHALPLCQEDISALVALYLKQQFSRGGLSEADAPDLAVRWQRVRRQMWRALLLGPLLRPASLQTA